MNGRQEASQNGIYIYKGEEGVWFNLLDGAN
jgi:hypothetical protein